MKKTSLLRHAFESPSGFSSEIEMIEKSVLAQQ
jgi:hypothetical protein